MASAAYSPYGVVQNSYMQFMGQGGNPSGMPSSIPQTPNSAVPGPVQYNTSLSNLRSQGDRTTINTQGNMSPSERIRAMADKQYEKWAAQQQFQSRVLGEFNDAKAQATKGLDQTPYNTYTPVMSSTGSRTNTWDNFMNSAGAPGLFGGSFIPVDQRYRNWNQAIANQQASNYQALTPVYQQFGMKMPEAPISSLW